MGSNANVAPAIPRPGAEKASLVYRARDWAGVLELLGCTVAAHALPAYLPCPLCSGKRLHVHEDITSRGTWHYCFDCRSAGDLFDLAAVVWNCSYDAAARRLIKEGLAESKAWLDTGRTQHEYQVVVAEFWAKTRRYFEKPPSPSARDLLGAMRIPQPTARWASGPGLVIGACDAKEAVDTLQPREFSTAKSPMGYRAGWKDILLAPHFDKPGRICGFAVVGRTGRADSRLFIPSPALRGPATITHAPLPLEGGLAGWETLEASKRVLGEHVIVVDCPFFAARLQARHIDLGSGPLPIVAYRDSPRERTNVGWNCLERRVPVFWSLFMTPATVHHAAQTNGRIALFRVSETGDAHVNVYIRDDPPLTHAHRAVKHSKPWQEALNAWAASVHETVVEELLMGLESYGDLKKYLGISEVMDAILEPPLKANPIVHLSSSKWAETLTIVEKDGCWFWKKAEGLQPLANAVLRLHKAVTRGAQTGYEGTLIHKGQTAPFFLAAKCPKGEVCAILQHALLQNGGSGILFIDQAWEPRLVELALLFTGLKPE